MTVPGYIIAAFTTLFGKQEYIVAEKKGATRKWYLIVIYLIKFLKFKTNNIVYHLVIPNLFECTLPNIVND